MGYNLESLNLKVTVFESHIRASDLAILLWSLNTLYEAMATVFLSGSISLEKRRQELMSDSNTLLRITKLSSGSDVNISVVGVDKVLEALRKIIDDIRFRKERGIQEEEKTKQEREKTQQMRLENIGRMLETFQEIKNLPAEDQREFLRLMENSILAIEENRNTLGPG